MSVLGQMMSGDLGQLCQVMIRMSFLINPLHLMNPLINPLSVLINLLNMPFKLMTDP